MSRRTSVLCRYFALFGLAGILTAACTSSTGLIPITDPTKRLDYPMFSILPPQGLNWIIISQSPYEVVFANRQLDTPRRPADPLHTFLLVIGVFDPQGADLKSPTGTQEMLNLLLGSPPKLRVLESQTVLDRSLGFGCRRYDSVVEERFNPRAPGAVLIVSVHGFICPHPHVPTLGVHLSYSERYIQGEQSWLSEALKQEAETSLRSVVFKPVR